MTTSLSLHITFDSETARALARLVRRKQMPDARVIALPDLLFLGPLAAAPSGLARRDWINAFDPARFDPWYCDPEAPEEFVRSIDAFWSVVRAHKGPATVWYSSASAQEYSGLVALIAHVPAAAQFDYINVHILPGKTQHRATVALAGKELIAALPFAARFSAHEIDAIHALSARLTDQNAPVRFVRGGQLLGGPADIHDAEIEAELESDYQSGSAALARIFSAQAREAWQADAAFYAFRMKALAASGAIDVRGDASEPDACEVRDLTPSPDMLDNNRLHVVGTLAALGLLRQYAISEGKKLRHIIETRTLFPSLGPITSLNTPEARLAWFQSANVDVHRHMGLGPETVDETVRDWHDLWARLDRWSGPVTIWMSHRSAADMSLRAAIAQHCRRAIAFDFIDMADPDLADPPLPNVERARADQIAAAARRARQLTPQELDDAQKDYARLSPQAKGLRYLKGGKLAEAPLDHFDKRILKIVTPEGRRLSRVMEEVLAEEGDEGFDQADHYFWLWRFEELVLAGEIAVEGRDYQDWRVKRVKKATVAGAGES